jgi:ABC-type multidrug transport system fused ATPase/permease subunit
MKQQLATIRRAWTLLTPFHKGFYGQILMAFILSGLSVAITYSGSKILTYITEDATNLVIYAFVSMFILEFIWNILNYIKQNAERKYLDQNIVQFLQEHSLRKILSLTPEQHIEDHSAIKQQVIARGETAIETVIRIFTSDILPNISYLFMALLALMWYSPIIGITTSIVCIILAIWIVYFMQYFRPFVQKNRDNWTEQAKIRTEAFVHLHLIKILSKGSYFIKKYINDRKKYAEYDKEVGLISLRHRSKRSIFISSADNLIFLVAVILVLKGYSEVGGLFLVWSIVGRVFWSISGLSNSLRDLPLRTLEAERYFEAIDLRPSFDEGGTKKADWSADIEFSNVSFGYHKNTISTFKNLSFVIPASKTTAFVGASGSGKSTIVKLLLRAYNYHHGSIKIGKEELNNIDAGYLRDHIGYVEQHVELLDDTVRENILISAPENMRSKAAKRLEEIARHARIDQFYHRLGKEKFETMVGERGIKLSGGERQRVGIARAIIKDPEILIFDEATSSLDSENEKYVMEAINDVSKGKTTIIIAHRLSTVRNADKIIVMDKGRIVGEGTHDELMQSSPVYQNLVAHQLS